MKAWKYQRFARTWHIHASPGATVLYIPEKNVALFIESTSFSGREFGVTREPRMIEEGKSVARGKPEAPVEVTITEIKEVDVDERKVGALVSIIDDRDDQEKRIKEYFKEVMGLEKGEGE